MVRKRKRTSRLARRTGRPLIGVTCEVHKLRPYYSEFELVCDYQYIRAIVRAGGIPLLIPINPFKRDIGKLLQNIKGLVIVGGADIHPSFYGEPSRHKIEPMYRGRTKFDMNLYHAAKRRKLPVLAICYGTQLLNVIYGGTLCQDIPKQNLMAKNHRSKRKPMHSLHIEKGSQLARMVGKTDFLVHSEHHQAVKRLGRSLRAVGYSSDWIIEAIEGPPKTIAVQWHPERQERDPVQKKLFRSFVEMCRKTK